MSHTSTSDMGTLSRKLFADLLRKRFSKTVSSELLDQISNDDLLRMHDEHANAVCKRIRHSATKRTEGIVNADNAYDCAQLIEAI
jgi:hypothetical protein